MLLPIPQEPLGILAVAFAFAQVQLKEALDDERIPYGPLPARLLQGLGQAQVVGARGFEHEQALGATLFDQLAKTRFRVRDF